MGKFGKKISISLNPLDYNLSVLGESGIGKTTLAKEVCEKLVGDEGYIHFDIGRERGADAIEGIVSEHIEDWAKLSEVIDDIVECKESDYPKLKVVIWDTLDELILLAEAESIRQYNKKQMSIPNGHKVDTIDAAWAGFGRGQAFAIELILNMFDKLNNIGVSNFIVAHVKRTDIIDAVTQETYSKLTADTTQRYFNAIKNKQHFIALAYIDRDVVKEKTGRKNVVTKEDITVSKAVKESRVISFRDDTYSVDSKSRFAEIVDKIPFDTDEFIKAITDAIQAEKTKNGKTMKEAEKEQAVKEKAKEEKAKAYSESVKKSKEVEKLEQNRDAYLDIISANFSSADKELKDKAKEMMKEAGGTKFTDPELDIETLKKIADLFK